MSLPPPPYESFKIRLRRAMADKGVSIYRLARLIDPDNPKSAERNLYRLLSPSSTQMPSRVYRQALARALGVDEDFFDPRIGVEHSLEIARAYAEAEIREMVILRRLWAPPGGPYGGYFLTREQRELIS